MIRHVPQSFRARVAQTKSAREVYALVSEASVSEFQDPLAVSQLYAQFGRFSRHSPLAQPDQTSLVLSKLATLDVKFPTASALVQSVHGMAQLQSRAFPKSWQVQLQELDLGSVILPDLVKLAGSFAVLRRRQMREEMGRIVDELNNSRRTQELERAPASQLCSLLSSLAAMADEEAEEAEEEEGRSRRAQLTERVWDALVLASSSSTSALKPELVAEALCSAGKLGLLLKKKSVLLVMPPASALAGIKSPTVLADCALGMSYSSSSSYKESAQAVRGAVLKRKLNEFPLVDLFKLHLAFLRMSNTNSNSSDDEEDAFQQRFYQLLRNRKVNEAKLAVDDAQFGFTQALELAQRVETTAPVHLFDDLAIVFRGQLRHATPGQLAGMLETMRQARYRNADLFVSVQEELSQHRKLRSFSPSELVSLVLTAAWFDYSKTGDLVDAASDHLASTSTSALSPEDRLRLAWALQALDHRSAQHAMQLVTRPRPDNSTSELLDMYSQLFHVKSESTAAATPTSSEVEMRIRAKFPSLQSDKGGVLIKPIAQPVDMFIPELNLCINVDCVDGGERGSLDSRNETRIGLARYKRKLLKQHGFQVLNINHFMLREDNLDKFFASLKPVPASSSA